MKKPLLQVAFLALVVGLLGHPVALALGWVDEGQGWEIFSLKIEEP